jgi:hypothetical protein
MVRYAITQVHGPHLPSDNFLSFWVPTKVVYERVLSRWQRVMPLEMLWFTMFLGENAKLTNMVICNGFSKSLVVTRRRFHIWTAKEFPLTAHMLKHSFITIR